MIERAHNFFSAGPREQRNLLMKTGTGSSEKGPEKTVYLMTQPQAQNQMMSPPTQHRGGDPLIRKESVLSSLQGKWLYFFLFPNSAKGSPFSTGPFILRSLILFTERLFSLTCIWVNQSLQQHLITAWALYVGEIMKHLISERNIKVQKDSSGRKWREITSFCTQPTSPSPFQIGWDSFCCPFCFCLEFNI